MKDKSTPGSSKLLRQHQLSSNEERVKTSRQSSGSNELFSYLVVLKAGILGSERETHQIPVPGEEYSLFPSRPCLEGGPKERCALGQS